MRQIQIQGAYDDVKKVADFFYSKNWKIRLSLTSVFNVANLYVSKRAFALFNEYFESDSLLENLYISEY